MIPTNEAAGVAASLTKAQRDALVNGHVTIDGRVLVDAGPVLGGSYSAWPEGMCRYYSARLDRLTDLGLRVRSILLEEKK